VGAPASLRAEKIFLGVIHRENSYVHPPAHQVHPQEDEESILGHFCCVRKILSLN